MNRRLMLAAASFTTLLSLMPIEGALGQRRSDDSRRDRSELEQDIRRGFSRAVREQVGLTEEQMKQLSAVTQRYARARRELQRDEEQTRVTLRRFIRDSASTDTAVDHAIQRLLAIQKRRVELLEGEQRELAVFMTPIQRARFMALQEQVRRRVEQRRRRPGNDRGDRRDGNDKRGDRER